MAQAIDSFGNSVEDFELNWQVTNEDVGQIDEHGSFTAGRAPGVYPDSLQVTVVQQLGEEVITRAESVDVIITGDLTELQIHPELATITPDRTVHFSVTGRDEKGVVLLGLLVLWSVSDENVGTIDAFGNFTAGEVTGMYQDVVRAEVIQTVPSGQ